MKIRTLNFETAYIFRNIAASDLTFKYTPGFSWINNLGSATHSRVVYNSPPSTCDGGGVNVLYSSVDNEKIVQPKHLINAVQPYNFMLCTSQDGTSWNPSGLTFSNYTVP